MLPRALRADTQHARSPALSWVQLAVGAGMRALRADIQHACSWRDSRCFARTLSTHAAPQLAGSRSLSERFCMRFARTFSTPAAGAIAGARFARIQYALQWMAGCGRSCHDHAEPHEELWEGSIARNSTFIRARAICETQMAVETRRHEPKTERKTSKRKNGNRGKKTVKGAGTFIKGAGTLYKGCRHPF